MSILVSIFSLLLYWFSAYALFQVEAKAVQELRESVRSVQELEV